MVKNDVITLVPALASAFVDLYFCSLTYDKTRTNQVTVPVRVTRMENINGKIRSKSYQMDRYRTQNMSIRMQATTDELRQCVLTMAKEFAVVIETLYANYSNVLGMECRVCIEFSVSPDPVFTFYCLVNILGELRTVEGDKDTVLFP